MGKQKTERKLSKIHYLNCFLCCFWCLTVTPIFEYGICNKHWYKFTWHKTDKQQSTAKMRKTTIQMICREKEHINVSTISICCDANVSVLLIEDENEIEIKRHKSDALSYRSKESICTFYNFPQKRIHMKAHDVHTTPSRVKFKTWSILIMPIWIWSAEMLRDARLCATAWNGQALSKHHWCGQHQVQYLTKWTLSVYYHFDFNAIEHIDSMWVNKPYSMHIQWLKCRRCVIGSPEFWIHEFRLKSIDSMYVYTIFDIYSVSEHEF